MKTKKTANTKPKFYTTLKSLLAAKTRKTLPRGTKAEVSSGDYVVFTDGKGDQIASIDLTHFVKSELVRLGFKVKE